MKETTNTNNIPIDEIEEIEQIFEDLQNAGFLKPAETLISFTEEELEAKRREIAEKSQIETQQNKKKIKDNRTGE